jgi:plastocyanin
MTDTPVEEAAETAETEAAGEVEASSTGVPAAGAPAEKPPFWHRPYVERFLVPLVLPLVVVLAIVVYVLNVSRMFLSAHGHIPVVVGTVITFAILLGAAWLSALPRLRPTSVVLLTAGFLFTMTISGWLTLGSSESDEEEQEFLAADLQTEQEAKIVAAPGGAYSYAPPELDAETGLVKFDVDFAAPGHTFAWKDPATLMPELIPDGTGVVSGVAYFGEAGDYKYFCTITGHEAAGMWGVVQVSGDAIPLEQALEETGNTAAAAGGEGG